jgi:hypothetical protein
VAVSKHPIPFGPFDLSPTPSLPAAGRVRASQQFAEVIHSGGDNRVRLSQQYLETIHSGGSNKIRLSQQFLEIVHTFGTPPPGKSGGSPGHNKQPQAISNWMAFIERERRHRNRHSGRFANSPVVLAPAYLPPNATEIRTIEVVKIVRIS